MDISSVAAIHHHYKNASIISAIDPSDQMWESGRDWYFSVGEDGLNNILSLLVKSRIQSICRILDVPCGHGRVARHLRAAFSQAQIVYCDLDESGADFCATTFGGEALHSQHELTAVNLGQQHDVIWVGSLFTHVDENRVRRWLGYLCQHLNQDGLLVATFHGAWSVEAHKRYTKLIDDRSWAQVLKEYESSGFGYADYDFMPGASCKTLADAISQLAPRLRNIARAAM